MSAIVFQWKQLVKGGEKRATAKKIDRIYSDCKGVVRKSEDRMQKLIQNYNQLASEVNQEIDQHLGDRQWTAGDEFKQKLGHLAFLNQFLGVDWSANQKKGITPLPLWNQVDLTRLDKPPKDLKPESCKTLGELQALLYALDSETKGVIKGKLVKIRGKGSIAVKDLQKRLLQLYQEALGKPHYRGVIVALQTSLVNSQLNRLFPTGGKLDKKLQKLDQTCIRTVEKNRQVMQALKEEYNELAADVNQDIRDGFRGFRTRGVDDEMRFKLDCLGKFLGVSLSHAQKMGQALLPELLTKETVSLSAYNHYAVVVNEQIHLRKDMKELNRLKRKMDPKTPLFAMLSKEEKQKLQKQIDKLKVGRDENETLLSKEMFDSLVNTLCECLELFEQEVTTQQKKGGGAFPVFGIDHQLDAIRRPTLKITSSLAAHEFNGLLKDVINPSIKALRIKKELGKLSQRGPVLVFPSDEEIKKHEELKKELEKVEGLTVDRPWLLERLSLALAWNHVRGFVKLDDEQEKGLKTWPKAKIPDLPSVRQAVKDMTDPKNMTLFRKTDWDRVVQNLPEDYSQKFVKGLDKWLEKNG